MSAAGPIEPGSPPSRQRLRRGEVELSCLDFGGAGTPVMLLHGLAGHGGEWRQTASWLTASHRVLALDERGHGESTRCPDDVSPHARVADVALAIERLADGPVVLAGQSLGAHLALLVAAAHPQLVRGLLVAEAHPGADPEGLAAASIERWFESWPTPFPTRDRAVAFFGGGLRGEAWADGLRSGPEGLEPRFEAARLARMLLEATAHDHIAEWESIAAPALVVRAGNGYFEAADLEALAARGARARYAELPRAGHDLHLEDPDGWRELLTGFLREID